MKKNKLPEPEIMVLYSSVSPNTVLKDIRIDGRGFVFGKVGEICKTLGIKIIDRGNHCEFRATKNKLQLFLEKLHFSGSQYWQP